MDLVFVQIIKRLLDSCHQKYQVHIYNLFSQAETLTNDDGIDLVIIDHQIIGASNFEIISFLRLKRKIVCPIISFGVAEYNGERNAILAGANYFFNKPYNPDEVEDALRKLLFSA